MIEKSLLVSTEISNLEVINNSTVATAVSQIGNLKVTRLIVTDPNGIALYDSLGDAAKEGKYIIFPEVAQAMRGNDVFSWSYKNGVMVSCAAAPVTSYGRLLGCVYIMEQDVALGALIDSLQRNIFVITIILGLAVILFSFVFSNAITKRLRRFMSSMRIIREGDYAHRVKMGGHDELTALGNEFNELTQKLYTSEQKRHQFVSDASHELKTPLASIKLLTDSILQNDMDRDTLHEFVEDIGNEADRLTRMSQKLLSLSRVDSQADEEYEIIYLTPTIEKVTRMLTAMAQKHNIAISKYLENDTPILIIEDDLYQIIFNLTENAIKYNRNGGKLSISIHRDDENVTLKIADTGVGIPSESLEHIFERFYRVDKARSRQSGGSGLGLSIVRSLVERNRGEISVESKPDVGTEFMLTFPIFDPGEVIE